MKTARIALTLAAMFGLATASVVTFSQSAARADDSMMKKQDTAKKDIIETATGPGMQEVTTVVTAIKAADLVETLKGKGPFTVFAPDERRLRQTARRHGRRPAQAREQGQAQGHPAVPRARR